jgi:hypothetical protein
MLGWEQYDQDFVIEIPATADEILALARMLTEAIERLHRDRDNAQQSN